MSLKMFSGARPSAAERAVGLYLFFVGGGMIAFWALWIYQGNLAEGWQTVENNNYIIFHITAEILAALLALAGGHSLFRGRGKSTALAALGALLYTSINSMAYSVLNDPSLTMPFVAVLVLSLVSLLLIRSRRQW